MSGFSCASRQEGDTVILDVSGEIDLAVADTLTDQAGAWIAPSRRLVLDCSGITFLDSTGLSALLTIQNAAADHRAGFALANLSDPVARVLELSGTLAVFTIIDDPAPQLTDTAA